MTRSSFTSVHSPTGPGRRLVLIPREVREHLRDLSVRQAKQGVRIFLFGSVARTWPRAAVGADFDVGFEIVDSTADREVVRLDLERELAALPSVRPTDLVDFSLVTEAFRQQAGAHVVELAHEPPSATAP